MRRLIFVSDYRPRVRPSDAKALYCERGELSCNDNIKREGKTRAAPSESYNYVLSYHMVRIQAIGA